MLRHDNKSILDCEQGGSSMPNPRLAYFEQEDILHLALSDETEMGSMEVAPDITAELNEIGELIGIEILNASAFIRDSVLDSVQARVLQLREWERAPRPVAALSESQPEYQTKPPIKSE